MNRFRFGKSNSFDSQDHAPRNQREYDKVIMSKPKAKAQQSQKKHFFSQNRKDRYPGDYERETNVHNHFEKQDHYFRPHERSYPNRHASNPQYDEQYPSHYQNPQYSRHTYRDESHSYFEDSSSSPHYNHRYHQPYPEREPYPAREPYTREMAYRQHQESKDWEEDEDDDYYEGSHDPEEWSNHPSPTRFIAAISGLILVAGISWFAYRWASYTAGDPPLISPEQGPFKVKPENPGGMIIPHQDKLVYDRITQNNSQTVERLLPPPESPPSYNQQNPENLNQNKYTGHSSTSQTANQNTYQNAAPPPPESGSPQTSQNNQAHYNTHNFASHSTHQNYSTNSEQVNASSPSSYNSTNQNSDELKKMLIESTDTIIKKEPILQSPSSSLEGFFVQLVTVNTEDAAKKEYGRLKNKYTENLKKIPFHIRPCRVGNEEKYRILVGPFKNKLAAQSKRKQIGISCRVIQLP